MHIAAALNRPIVALYGSTSEHFTPPLTDKVTLLSTAIACRPCFKRECPLWAPPLLNRISTRTSNPGCTCPGRGANQTTPMRVLIVKVSSLGDIIHTMPALSDARAMRPDLKCDWVVEENYAEVPTWHPAVTTVIPVALPPLAA